MGCGRRPPAMVFTSTHSPWRITRIGNLLSFLGPRLTERGAGGVSAATEEGLPPVLCARPTLPRSAHRAHRSRTQTHLPARPLPADGAAQSLSLSAAPPSQMPPRRKRGPPCVNTDSCADVNTDGGQWTYLPEPFLDAHPGQYDKDDCYCKRAACREFVGVKSAPMKPWGKRTLTAVSCTAMAMGRELGRQSLPRPPILVQIKEIWGERSPRPCLPLSPVI